VPLAPAAEEAIVDHVAFFTKRGKAAGILERKTTFRWKVKRAKREACRS